MNTLLILGMIFILGGILVYYLGMKKGVYNIELWALFPIFHGLHEFADYFISIGNENLLLEQFEVAIAFASTFALLAASIEMLGVIPHPFGKLTSGLSFTIILYFVFASDTVFEVMENTTFQGFGFHTTYFRLMFGFIITFIALLSIYFSYLYLYFQGKKKNSNFHKGVEQLTYGSIALLLVFAVFEGFDSTNSIWVTLRGISAIIFLLIPVYTIYTSKLGLTRLLITQKDGNYVLGYDFLSQSLMADEQAILTASFIAAINSFTQQEVDIGSISGIKTQLGIIQMVHTGKYILTLQTRTTSKTLEKQFTKFAKQIDSIITTTSMEINYEPQQIKELVQQYFSNFM